jgi:hypothetical protein
MFDLLADLERAVGVLEADPAARRAAARALVKLRREIHRS